MIAGDSYDNVILNVTRGNHSEVTSDSRCILRKCTESTQLLIPDMTTKMELECQFTPA